MIDSTLMPQGDDQQEIQVISENAIVTIKISTGFYKRIQALLSNTLEGKSTKDIHKMHEEIASKKVENPETFHYETLLILCNEFETKAKEQGFVEKTTIGELKTKLKDSGIDDITAN